MKILYLLFTIVNSEQIIKNINIPSCRNCIYYKPPYYSSDFSTSLSKCNKFGTKDIITNKISYDEFADLCRRNEDKCGNEGKYFEKEDDLKLHLKIINYKIQKNIFLYTFVLTFSSYLIFIFSKLLEK